MSDINSFFTVVKDNGGRMKVCAHMHLTRKEAEECAKEGNSMSIIEWVKDRNPQFEEVWRHPDHVDPKLS